MLPHFFVYIVIFVFEVMILDLMDSLSSDCKCIASEHVCFCFFFACLVYNSLKQYSQVTVGGNDIITTSHKFCFFFLFIFSFLCYINSVKKANFPFYKFCSLLMFLDTRMKKLEILSQLRGLRPNV